MPRFSLITITFNAEKYLKEALDSVVAQDFAEFEHILWDGGSTDRTLEIASSYPHLRLHQGRDEGIGDAMNRAAALASGDFLLFLHADDLLAHPNTLTQIDTALAQHPCAWLYGQAYIIDCKGLIVKTTPFIPFDARRLRKYNIITHPASVVSRALFQKAGGFATHLRYCMDYDLWLRLAQLATPFALPVPLACFREHGGSLSTSEPAGVADEAYAVRNRYVKNPIERWKSYRTWKKRRARA